jgi:hypothetical protein
MDFTPNIPEVVAEVRALFERYEQALVDKDVDVLDATFWDSPHTIRYALNEHGYGFAAIHAHRVARPPGHQGAAHSPRDPHARLRRRYREPRVQGARPRPRRTPEPDVGTLPRPRLAGGVSSRVHPEPDAAVVSPQRHPRVTCADTASHRPSRRRQTSV